MIETLSETLPPRCAVPTAAEDRARIARELGLVHTDEAGEADEASLATAAQHPAVIELDAHRGGPGRRHAARVSAARQAVMGYCRKIIEARGLDHTLPIYLRVDLAALLILHADHVGIGGERGVGGDATDRHPALAELGKGRKNATDGPAWTAAIKEARDLMRCRFGNPLLVAVSGEDGPVVGWSTEPRYELPWAELLPPAWRMSVAALMLHTLPRVDDVVGTVKEAVAELFADAVRAVRAVRDGVSQ